MTTYILEFGKNDFKIFFGMDGVDLGEKLLLLRKYSNTAVSAAATMIVQIAILITSFTNVLISKKKGGFMLNQMNINYNPMLFIFIKIKII